MSLIRRADRARPQRRARRARPADGRPGADLRLQELVGGPVPSLGKYSYCYRQRQEAGRARPHRGARRPRPHRAQLARGAEADELLALAPLPTGCTVAPITACPLEKQESGPMIDAWGGSAMNNGCALMRSRRSRSRRSRSRGRDRGRRDAQRPRSAGSLCETTGGGRFVKIPGFPGEQIDRRLLTDVDYLQRALQDLRHRRLLARSGPLAQRRAPDRPRRSTSSPTSQGRQLEARSTRLAEWAEPRQDHPRAPFRWVGYNGDAGHGRGDHLHLSYSHSPTSRKTRRGRVDAEVPRRGRRAAARRRRRRQPAAPRRRRAQHSRAAGPRRRRAGRHRDRGSRRGRRRELRQAGPCGPTFESGPRAFPSWLAPVRPIRVACSLPLKAASFRT